MSASIIVEDGTIVANANSYVTTAQLSTFASNRGITISGTLADLLIKAMDYLEQLDFKGTRRTRDQSLQWPRYDVVVDGYYQDPTVIPQALKDGLCHCAIAIDQSNDPLQDLVPSPIKQVVGPIEVDYSPGTIPFTINRRVLNSLKKLLNSSNGVSKA